MRKIPFCRECVFYGGRKNGAGICKRKGEPLVAEHIKSDFWCINGVIKGCESCEYKEGDSGTGRCAYCKNMWNEFGSWSEWEIEEASAKRAKI